MKRGDFFKEMGNSLFQTMKSVYGLFLQDNVNRVEEAADWALGITWMPLMDEKETPVEIEMKFISGKPIIVSRNGTNMRAMDGVCPVCSNIIILTTLYPCGKCLNCQKEFNFKTLTGDLLLETLPTKLINHTYFVGFNRHKEKR